MDRHEVNSARVYTHTHTLTLSLSLSLAQMESSVLVILQILSSPPALFRPAVHLKPTSLAALPIFFLVSAPAVMEGQEDTGASFPCSLDSSSRLTVPPPPGPGMRTASLLLAAGTPPYLVLLSSLSQLRNSLHLSLFFCIIR